MTFTGQVFFFFKRGQVRTIAQTIPIDTHVLTDFKLLTHCEKWRIFTPSFFLARRGGGGGGGGGGEGEEGMSCYNTLPILRELVTSSVWWWSCRGVASITAYFFNNGTV